MAKTDYRFRSPDGGNVLLAVLRDAHSPKETPLFFECFPYVCPEPVLVK
jgi:hypothetical protein